MQEPKDPQQRLRELERTRQKAVEQINSSYGSVRAELQKIIAQIDAEIAEIRRNLPEN